MARCKRCNVAILDNTNICPLCYCALEGDKREKIIDEYPEIRFKRYNIKHVGNIILTAVLISAIALIVLNGAVYTNQWWCIIPIASSVYLYLIFRLIFVSNKGYRLKIFQSTSLSLILLLIIDVATGFYRWSINYILPSAVIIIDLVSIILMLTNMKNWQEYLIMQIIAIAFGLIPLLLWIAGVITNPLLTIIAAGIAVLLFVGLLIVGDFKSRDELKRRFHIK